MQELSPNAQKNLSVAIRRGSILKELWNNRKEIENRDQLRFLGKWTPTPPLRYNFALTEK